jgi:hypothetical protein
MAKLTQPQRQALRWLTHNPNAGINLHTCDALVRMGLAEHYTHPRDDGKRWFRITDAGRKAIEESN